VLLDHVDHAVHLQVKASQVKSIYVGLMIGAKAAVELLKKWYHNEQHTSTESN
jgi:hypothetical protein